ILNEKLPPTEFVGYDRYTDVDSVIQAIFIDGKPVDVLHHGSEGGVVLSPTPFYAESGGQIGDTGTLEWDGGRATVLNTQKIGDLTISRVRVDEGSLAPSMHVRASVPVPTRLDTTANHTATHLLHKALKDILGATVQQAGSLVAPDRLRFDYTYHQPLTGEQLLAIEAAVNERIRENLEVTKRVLPIEEAKRSGAVAMFGEKYGEHVRIVSAGEYSREFCGGCHVNRTGDIGVFKIVSDRSLAAGVRRMEALTGRGALEYFRTLETNVEELQRQLQEKQKQFEKELKQLRTKLATGGGGAAREDDGAIDVDGVKLLTRRVDEISGGDLRNLADTLRSRLKSGIVILGSYGEGKSSLLAAVTKDLVERIPANTLIQQLAPIVGGKGGGKSDLAQAGGKDPDKLNDALNQAPATVRALLGA
ncbi:MAG TPA: DHHA1 domain-containing protein, partial [Thermoanaerobaculia bacterium]|nr:DHHA1 domain-containing protein [Thermoanaerobaculia bacterium]